MRWAEFARVAVNAGRVVTQLGEREAELKLAGRALLNAAVAVGFPVGALFEAWRSSGGDPLGAILRARASADVQAWVLEWAAAGPRDVRRRAKKTR